MRADTGRAAGSASDPAPSSVRTGGAGPGGLASDAELLDSTMRARAGSLSTAPEAVFIASFAEFYQIHYGKIAASLAINFGDAELGSEATDEAMTRAFSQWGTVSGHDNPAGWVYRVGLNWGRSWYRRAGRRLPWFDRSSTELPEVSDPTLQAAIGSLDHKHRAVVVCRYYLDWSTNQTAAALDIPTGTVKSRLHQALAELRSVLEPTPPGADDISESVRPPRGHSDEL